MIFDCAYVTALVEKWQHTQDPKVLDLILEYSRSLIEAIVSGFDSMYRDDLIQEASLKLQYALPYFDQNIANLHTYLTTVIKNTCLTYLRKQNKISTEFQVDLTIYGDTLVEPDTTESEDILNSLMIRNRRRFPTIDVHTIDEISEQIYTDLTFGLGKGAVISNLTEIIGCTRQLANTIYNSSLIYLRSKYISFASTECTPIDEELSIIPDLKELLGDKAGDMIASVLTGMSIKFP